MEGPYCTLADVLALVSQDAEARMATDPAVAVSLGLAGTGGQDIFETPFYGSTTLTTFVDNGATASTILPGQGTNGTDQVQFSPAVAEGSLVTCKADQKAVNTAVIQALINDASQDMRGYFARYGDLPADALSMVRPRCVFLVRWKLRQRRNMNEWDPIIKDFERLEKWLEGVATGKIALTASTPVAQATLPASPAVVRAEPSVYEPPLSTTPWGPF
jgi:phage gp36-like protein